VAGAWLLALIGCVLWPRSWLYLVPALLPVLCFSPWTGWTLFSEFDLLLCAVCAAGWWRVGRAEGGGFVRDPAWADFWVGAFVLTSVISLLRGQVLSGAWLPGDPWSLPGLRALLFSDGESAANGWRNAKSALWLAAIWPLWRIESAQPARRNAALQALAQGMVAGMVLLCVVVVWERLAFSGLWDRSSGYRVMGWFWEMHTGGAAIDMYLALATPFVTWHFAQSWFTPEADTPFLKRMESLAWLVLTVYAVLATFSRSAYVAVILPNLVLLACLHQHRTDHLRSRWLGSSMGILVVLLAGAVWGGGFLQTRMERSIVDLHFRVAHWHHALSILRTWHDVVLGTGLGRVPTLYAQRSGNPGGATDVGGRHPGSGWSGRARWAVSAGDVLPGTWLVLSGPDRDPNTRGLWALQQRMGGFEPSAYQVRLRARADQATDVGVKVCEQHVVYAFRCMGHVFRVRSVGFGGGAGWQDFQAVMQPMDSQPDEAGHLLGRRPAVFSIAVLTVGAQAEISDIQVVDPEGDSRLRNGDFARASEHWFAGAASYYLPWHVDNLYLELLLERGVVGLALLLVACVWLGQRLSDRRRFQASSIADQGLDGVLCVSVASALLLGLVGSLMDVPRVSVLFLLLLAVALQCQHKLVKNDGNA
jgi:hypothetical protein